MDYQAALKLSWILLLHFDVSYMCMSITLLLFAGISDEESHAVAGPLSGPWLEP